MLEYLSQLHRATRQIGLWFEERMTDVGITPHEGHMLSYLRSYAPCPISELVRVFGLKHSTTTSRLDRLENEGLIERLPNPDDRRSFLIRLTRKGRLSSKRVQKLAEEIEAAIDRNVSSEQLGGFHGVIDAVEKATSIKVR